MARQIWQDHLVILLGLRSVCLLVSMLLIVVGGWRAARAWDNEQQAAAAAASQATADDSYQNMPEGGGIYTPPSSTTTDASSNTETFWQRDISLRNAILQAKPSQRAAMFGWILLAVALLFDRHDWVAFLQTRGSTRSLTNTIFSMILVLALGVWHTVVFPAALNAHQVKQHYRVLLGSLWCLYLFLGLCVMLHNHNHGDSQVPSFLPLVSVAALALAPAILWMERHHLHNADVADATFDTTTTTSRPTGRAGAASRILPVTMFSLGGPLQVFGWWGLFVSLTAVHGNPATLYLPLYHVPAAWSGAIWLQLLLWAIGYAYEQNHATAADGGAALALAGGVARRLAPKHVKYILIPLAWSGWCLAPLVSTPYGVVGYWPWLAAAVCIAQAAIWAVVYDKVVTAAETAAAAHSSVLHQWLRGLMAVACLWLVIMVLGVWFSSHNLVNLTAVIVSGLLGGIALVWGLYVLRCDSCRGQEPEMTSMDTAPVVRTGASNNKKEPIMVFSHGALLVPVGLLCLAYTVSLPLG